MSDTQKNTPTKPDALPDAALGEQVDGAIDFDAVVSGQFDQELDALDEPQLQAPQVPPKRVLLPKADSPKLHKVLAQAGLGSRLEMEQFIVQGRILVNNKPAHVGQRIQMGDVIRVDGKVVHYKVVAPPPRVLAYHKPAGEVVTHDDPQNRPTVFRRLPRLEQGKWQSVGRLDLNTEGLLLLTNAGDLANQLMHPRFGLQREYAVRVLGALSNEEKSRLLQGVQLEDGMAQFQTLANGGGEGANCWYRVTISEGRNREVRRMFEAVGHAVSRLIRIRYGAVMLPRGLKRGGWVELDWDDIRRLTDVVGFQVPELNNAPAHTGRRDSPIRPPQRGAAQSKFQRVRGAAADLDKPPPQGFIGADAVRKKRERADAYRKNKGSSGGYRGKK
jgi:23S rRNA pseudouridine2605 synthase